MHFSTLFSFANFYVSEGEYEKAQQILKKIKSVEGKGGVYADLALVNIDRVKQDLTAAVIARRCVTPVLRGPEVPFTVTAPIASA